MFWKSMLVLCGFVMSVQTQLAYAEADRPRVDALIVFAVDTSSSIDFLEYKKQRDGHAKAIMSDKVLSVIEDGHFGKIAVAYVEWNDRSKQDTVVDWMVVEDEQSAESFATRVLGGEEPSWVATRLGTTSIAEAINHSLRLLRAAPYRSSHWVIDVSGDGDNSYGDLKAARANAVALGVVINGLVILDSKKDTTDKHINPPGGLENYYEREVIGGSGSFVEVADGYENYAEALSRKLAAEIVAMR